MCGINSRNSYMMVIREQDTNVFYVCPNRAHFSKLDFKKEQKENILHYYSEEHAVKDGWLKTNDLSFCHPNLPYVWVCPKCARKAKRRKYVE
jgi:hypothetical protein